MKIQTIKVLVQEDKASGWWSAQCLDYDVAVQARCLPDLIYEIQRVIMGHVEVSQELGVEPFLGLKPAPPVFWQIFDQAKIHVKREPVPFSTSHAPIHSDVRLAEMCPA